jgi:DNA-binding SARP family transcriptional activator
LHADVLRALAGEAAAAGDDATAIRCHLQALERDPYDEGVHLGLVRLLADTGRHGEAHRRYLVYAAAMRELGSEPAAFPELAAHTLSADR